MEYYSNSRIQAYRTCQKKFYYEYIEGLEPAESEALILGSAFHKVLEYHYMGKADEALAEYEQLVRKGTVTTHIDLFAQVYREYLNWYAEELDREELIANEKEILVPLDKEKQFMVKGIIDKIVAIDSSTIMRDHKTTSGTLKYDTDKVMYNPQQLLYKPMAEHEFKRHIDAIEIDEIRLKMLEPVPMLKGNKPTKALRSLTLVTADAYLNKLEELGLDNDKEYLAVYDQLVTRGHPLFRRVQVQILEEQLIRSNLQDVLSTCKDIEGENEFPRTIAWSSCQYCGFKELCRLDMQGATEADRAVIIATMDLKEKDK